jgi:plasmid stability protein
MASILIRNLSDETKVALRIRAAENGRSMEEEARCTLDQLVKDRAISVQSGNGDWVDQLSAKMKEIGAEELVIPDYEAEYIPIDLSQHFAEK